MANRNRFAYLNHSDGTELNAAAGYTADFNSEWTPVHGDWLCIAIKNLNASGSSMTLTPALQCTPDDGTSIFSFPDDKNSQTQAAFADMGVDDDTGLAMEYYINPFPIDQGPNSKPWKFRVVFNYGGTIGTNTVTAWYSTRNTTTESG